MRADIIEEADKPVEPPIITTPNHQPRMQTPESPPPAMSGVIRVRCHAASRRMPQRAEPRRPVGRMGCREPEDAYAEAAAFRRRSVAVMNTPDAEILVTMRRRERRRRRQ